MTPLEEFRAGVAQLNRTEIKSLLDYFECKHGQVTKEEVRIWASPQTRPYIQRIQVGQFCQRCGVKAR